MRKIIFIITLIIFTAGLIFSEQQFKLGVMKTKRADMEITYIKDVNRDFIKLYVKAETAALYIYLPNDLKLIREHIDKFQSWYKIATDNKSVLNKTVGTLSTFKLDFITTNGNYEAAFIETRNGLNVAVFDLAQIKAFKEMISDENIDKALNEEKRKKEKEDSLFR